MATQSDLSDLESLSIQQVQQNLYMDLMALPPSIIDKQQSKHQKISHSASQKLLSSQQSGFYSRVISANQPKKKTDTIDKKYSEFGADGSIERELSQQKSQQKSISQFDTTSQSLYQLLVVKEKQIDELQKKFTQSKNQLSKQSNKQGLNFMTGYSDQTIQTLKDIALWENITKEQQDLLQGVIRDSVDFVNSLNEIFRLQQHHVQLCTHRLQHAENIVKQLDSGNAQANLDSFTLRKQMAQLLESVNSVQTSELNANCLFRDLQRINLQYSQLLSQYEKVARKAEHQEKSIVQHKKNYQYHSEEITILKKDLRKEKDKNAANGRKINVLEQRLEVFQGQEQIRKDKDSLKNIIDEMIKENEQNKRKAHQKSQELIKLEQTLAEIKERNHQLTKRNYILEKQMKAFGFNSMDLTQSNGIVLNQSNRIAIQEESIEEDKDRE